MTPSLSAPAAMQAATPNNLPKALDKLRDIYMPPEPSMWPPAPGWWIVFGLFLITLLILGFYLWKKRKERLWQEKVLAEVDKVITEHSDNYSLQLAGLSEILRRTALQQFPREDVATLHGKDWLDFLNQTGGNGEFSKQYAEALADGVYRSLENETPLNQDSPLVKAVHRWLRRNLS